MLEPVLREIRNYYFTSEPVKALGVADSVILCDISDFEQGQYVYIHKHSTLTGVHQISAVEELGLFVENLADTNKPFEVYALNVPQDVLELVKRIEQFNKDNPNGVASESLGDYSVSYSSQDGVASWQSAFNHQLANYRRVFLEMPR